MVDGIEKLFGMVCRPVFLISCEWEGGALLDKCVIQDRGYLRGISRLWAAYILWPGVFHFTFPTQEKVSKLAVYLHAV
jgi:hypothetical protein